MQNTWTLTATTGQIHQLAGIASWAKWQDGTPLPGTTAPAPGFPSTASTLRRWAEDAEAFTDAEPHTQELEPEARQHVRGWLESYAQAHSADKRDEDFSLILDLP